MVAHAGLQGTVRPTRYAVLMDQNNLSADDFQRLTNNLCWSYARATRAVSIGTLVVSFPTLFFLPSAVDFGKVSEALMLI